MFVYSFYGIASASDYTSTRHTSKLRQYTYNMLDNRIGEQDVSAQDVSATRWRKTFRQQNVAETSFTCCEDVSAPKTFRQQEE